VEARVDIDTSLSGRRPLPLPFLRLPLSERRMQTTPNLLPLLVRRRRRGINLSLNPLWAQRRRRNLDLNLLMMGDEEESRSEPPVWVKDEKEEKSEDEE